MKGDSSPQEPETAALGTVTANQLGASEGDKERE